MKIAIDAKQYSKHITGTDRMAGHLIEKLQNIDQSNTYRIITNRNSFVAQKIKSRNFSIIFSNTGTSFGRIGKVPKKLNNLLVLAYLRLVYRPDVYFSFHNMTTEHRLKTKKNIVSVLDLIPIIFDEYETGPGHSKESYLKKYRKAIKDADSFLAISEYSKHDLIKYLGVEKNKIEVMYLAVDENFGKVDRKMFEKIRKKYSLPDRFVFTIGGNEPRKNVISIVQAYEKLPDKFRDEHPLVIGGGSWRGKSISGLERPYTKTIGYIDDEDLPTIYSMAEAFIFASKYEGFGFTVLEAMSCRTPVITTRSSSLPEVAGNAALYVDAHDAKAFADSILQVINDGELRKTLIDSGNQQVKNFSWEKSAKILHRILTA